MDILAPERTLTELDPILLSQLARGDARRGAASNAWRFQ
jgi:hypothetical protein